MSELVNKNVGSRSALIDYDIDKLYEIIWEITKIHDEFSKEHELLNDFNLKKIEVRDILSRIDNTNTYLVEKDFLISLRNYIAELDFLTIDIDLEYTYNEQDLRLRVKQPESIIYKLNHYYIGKRESGAIPLNKCLNDLLGFRINMESFNHNCLAFTEMCDQIRKKHRIRYINSSKGNYNATHIYFLGEKNKHFPWELQIWTPEHYQSNYESHYKHKQEYTKSAQIHKEAFGNKGVV